MLKKKILINLNDLIEEGGEISSIFWKKIHRPNYNHISNSKDETTYKAYRAMCLSFMEKIGAKETQFYRSYNDTDVYNGYQIDLGVKILERIKVSIEKGWFNDLKNLISAEIFSDFLEMAKYLLSEGYKDPAAVIIGSVLEEHLRALCTSSNIDVVFSDRKGNLKPKKADSMNNDLAKKYGKLEQKSVTAWLDLRNKAAHGEYDKYDYKQVESMLDGVSNFIVRNPL